MNSKFAELAVEALNAMYDHNSKVRTSVGRTDIGPETLTAEQVANDLRIIYTELVKADF
ncbi:hypothetical protein [Sporosarcina sp. G11-34]|uniref:hypothetical protein n=1 Tax=Sporosarcina sp. G11-34 TaxID=2849605 RepID=UPI0022A8DA02|nr:hypothetical protein [Sporosarcina sp. G11-34]MCZ2260628.1 hypothetical protein [Sporosarcina sp. G11-34]